MGEKQLLPTDSTQNAQLRLIAMSEISTPTDNDSEIAALFGRLNPRSDADVEAMKTAKAEREGTAALATLKLKANVPLRHWERTVDRSGPWATTESGLRQKLGTGFMVALCGTNGGGKTQLGVELIRHQMAVRFKSALFTDTMQFFMAIKASYRSDKETEKQVIGRFLEPQLLVIDEMDKRAETAWENNMLFYMVNQRYNAVLDTVMLFNADSTTASTQLGPSVVSRLNETGGLVDCKWPTRR